MNNQSVLEKYPSLTLLIPLHSYCQRNAGLGWRGENKNISKETHQTTLSFSSFFNQVRQ